MTSKNVLMKTSVLQEPIRAIEDDVSIQIQDSIASVSQDLYQPRIGELV